MWLQEWWWKFRVRRIARKIAFMEMREEYLQRMVEVIKQEEFNKLEWDSTAFVQLPKQRQIHHPQPPAPKPKVVYVDKNAQKPSTNITKTAPQYTIVSEPHKMTFTERQAQFEQHVKELLK